MIKKLLLPSLGILPLVCMAGMVDEVHLNAVETPDQASAFYIDDAANTGEVFGPPGHSVGILDPPHPEDAIQIGDVGSIDHGFFVRKGFLLFRLPALEGKKLSRATLQLFLAQIIKETPEKPLPPVWLFHASDWQDASWDGSPRFKGLLPEHFGDKEIFRERIPVCGQEDAPDPQGNFITLDVTEMIRNDYQRSDAPVTVFRLEVSEHEQLDITDEFMNLYIFWGPNTPPHIPERIPTLVLSFE